MANKFNPTHRITLDRGDVIEVMLDDGRAYQRCEWDAADAADYERADDGRWLFQGQAFNGRVEEIAESEYRIAFAKADGSWDVVETFKAAGDDDANRYAEQNYDGQDWYVLDAQGRNINGGRN